MKKQTKKQTKKRMIKNNRKKMVKFGGGRERYLEDYLNKILESVWKREIPKLDSEPKEVGCYKEDQGHEERSDHEGARQLTIQFLYRK
jgi:hypothetical protein